MRKIFLIILIPFIGFSQNTRKVFIETGITINTPFQKDEFIAYNNYQSNTLFYNKFYNSPGFYTKLGIDMHPEKGKKFYVTVPLFAAYKEFNKKIVGKTLIDNNTSIRNLTQEIKISSKSITLSIGPKFNFELNKLIYFASINLNADVLFMNNYVIDFQDESGLHKTSKSSLKSNDIMFSTSLQIGISYIFSKKWEIGLSGESYIYNFNSWINNDKENTQIFNIGYGKSSSLFCVGLRGSYKF